MPTPSSTPPEASSTQSRIDLIYFDAGGGHRGAALALIEAMRLQQRPWEPRMVNLQELLEPMDIARRLFGINVQEVYNLGLRRGWTLGAAPMLKVLHGLIRLTHRHQVRLLAEHWRRSRPDLVVSLIPNFNRAIEMSLRAALPGVPRVTVLTDMADYPPHFWLERETRAAICGTAEAAAQASAVGLPPERVFNVSGMILHPRLYEDGEQIASLGEERRRLGLREDLTTALVLFGGYGSSRMLDIARRLERSGLPLQLILVCGHNQRLRQRLEAVAARAALPMRVEGFTKEIPKLMRLSHFMIGKPGPASVSEAIHMGLPVVVECNAWTLPQERFNAGWIEAKRVGAVYASPRRLTPAIKRLLDPEQLAEMRANAARIRNRAVWEIPEIFANLLAGQRSAAGKGTN